MQARLRPRSREAQRGATAVLPVPRRVGPKSAKAVTTIRIVGISGVGRSRQHRQSRRSRRVRRLGRPSRQAMEAAGVMTAGANDSLPQGGR